MSRRENSFKSIARWSVGIILLLVTVFLWTTSNFLASTIFADNTYSKPYLVTYFNTALFSLALVPSAIRHLLKTRRSGIPIDLSSIWRRRSSGYVPVHSSGRGSVAKPDNVESRRSVDCQVGDSESIAASRISQDDVPLTFKETAKLSLEFCIIWFVANYFTSACLEYTSVASSTILLSTSSIWTLFFGSVLRVEHFTLKKFIGVLASMAGVILVSSVDLSGETDENRGSFPHKSKGQIALGDTLAFLSAVMYGLYTVLLKKRIGNESRVQMPLFFGLVGLFNLLLLWPGFIILHFTGVESFQLPPTARIFSIVFFNGLTSVLSDFTWAYAMLLTSPLIVTVGLSLTIPLSIVGQVILNDQRSGPMYWLGACVVFLSFAFINHEEKEDVPASRAADRDVDEELARTIE
ncbi:hypothetical protein L228DRAFT_206852 [Xylona heveae TC161]|uniref:Uncharacterized protein n=1 Tax=Xylona heveae (strain CBS 132557 / TC161) TaxID=1328760 RepID=A0A165JT06_XYLHT|nr:hypothetical protein L228DRAFT_206852 [Xylona heveae TC161]KZF26584.1 hypothetical protein L228DRAFT_206852 [Xylona heveae TC161]